jgi:hypothetical protein
MDQFLRVAQTINGIDTTPTTGRFRSLPGAVSVSIV